MQGVQSSLALAQKQRNRTVWRFDGGGGSEDNFRLLLQQGYHVHAKGLSSSRAAALAKGVTRWDAYDDVWFGEVKPAFNWGRPLRVFVQRRLKNAKVLHSYYVSTLTLPAKKRLFDRLSGTRWGRSGTISPRQKRFSHGRPS